MDNAQHTRSNPLTTSSQSLAGLDERAVTPLCGVSCDMEHTRPLLMHDAIGPMMILQQWPHDVCLWEIHIFV